MSAWEASVARADFRALLEATAAAPQVVVRHGEPVAVIMSPEEYRRLRRLAGVGMARFLASTPFEDGDIPPTSASLSGPVEGMDHADGVEGSSEEVPAGHGV